MESNVESIDVHSREVDPKTTAWRYMSLEKFMPMLVNEMYFPRPSQFSDKWEGMFPPSYMRRVRKRYANDPELLDIIADLEARLVFHRHTHFVSCWHMSNRESDAMWRGYSMALEGLAIKTTVGDLINEFRPHNHGSVFYYEPAKEQVTDSLFGLSDILCKRADFSWEREYRIWFDDEDLIKIYNDNKNFDCSQFASGRQFRFCNAKQLIHEIVVAPYAPKAYLDKLKRACVEHGREWLVDKIKRSSMDLAWDDYVE